MMIDQAQINQLEEAIDSFEENWSASSRDGLIELLRSFHLQDDLAALTELVRVDIELRYKNRLSPEPEEYFKVFPQLETDPECVALIAFEDFRARTTHGHSLSPARWQNLPGVRDEVWFRQLQETPLLSRGVRASVSTSKVKGVPQSDPAFEQELEDAGFRLVHEIGQGAFSRVYLAIQHDLADRYVVLKVVNEALAEPQSLAMLQHTNIVPIYSFHEILKRSVICMPYAGSVTLEQFLANRRSDEGRAGESLVITVRNRAQESTVADSELQSIADSKPVPLTPAANEKAVLRPLERLQSLDCGELAIWVFQRLASALAHSHARGVLHGDLKPANVLIRNDGEPALLDFNLSQTLDRSKPKFFGGTLPYMPPEALRILMGQKGIEQGVASDIYGLGMMLFEFVTGRLAFPAPPSMAPADLQLALQARIDGKPDWRESDDVSVGLRAIIDKCVNPDPSRRYQCAEDLQQDLEREQASLPLLHATEPRRVVLKKWAQRHPRFLSGGTAALVGGLLLVILGTVAASWRNTILAIEAQVHFEEFKEASARSMADMMVNWEDQKSNGVGEALELVHEYEIGEPSNPIPFHPTAESADAEEQRRVVLRHIIHAGLKESYGLRLERQVRDLRDQDLERLRELMELGSCVTGETESRGMVWLEARWADLKGDADLSAELTRKAESMPIDSLTEKYLEAARLFHERNTEDVLKSRDLFNELADQNAVPPVVRWTALGRTELRLARARSTKSKVLIQRARDAVTSLTQAIEYSPQSDGLYFWRGQAQEFLDENRAIADYSESIRLNDAAVNSFQARGVLYLRNPDRETNGMLELGLADYEKALELSPQRVDVLLSRAAIYRAIGKHAEAEQDYQAAMERDNLFPGGYVTRATVRRRVEDDLEGAIKDLKEAERMQPKGRAIKFNLAQNYRQQGRLNEAVEKLTEILELYPGNEAALVDRAILYVMLGDEMRARLELDAVMKDPQEARTYYQAACALALLPDFEDHMRANNYLAVAIRKGYEIEDALSTDEDLESLRKMPGFRALVKVESLVATADIPRTIPTNPGLRN